MTFQHFGFADGRGECMGQYRVMLFSMLIHLIDRFPQHSAIEPRQMIAPDGYPSKNEKLQGVGSSLKNSRSPPGGSMKPFAFP